MTVERTGAVSRSLRRTGAVLLVMTALLGLSSVALVRAIGVDRPARATVPAERIDTVRLAPEPPSPPGCRRVVVIGDSLMDNARPWLIDELERGGVPYTLDAQPSRRIPATLRVPLSGVQAARSVRASAGEADCWVVALGSNDLIFGGGDPDTAAALIDEMLQAVTPGAHVWWVNLHYRRDPRTSFDFPAATAAFNTALDRRADADERMRVIDWYSLIDANLRWFFDPVHVDRTGSMARARQTVGALPLRRP